MDLNNGKPSFLSMDFPFALHGTVRRDFFFVRVRRDFFFVRARQDAVNRAHDFFTAPILPRFPFSLQPLVYLI
jgi:hypothetical protein